EDWILAWPVRSDRLARPLGHGFAGCGIAQGEDEVEIGRALGGKIKIVIRPQTMRGISGSGERIQGWPLDCRLRFDSRTEATKPSLAMAVENRFGHDAARGIAA